ncbi:MAG: DUF4105 domain-containing protein [Lewinellaceae bacterium]|nr:DUF4105 domain-containing protein [Lewinellaceae bacterium]
MLRSFALFVLFFSSWLLPGQSQFVLSDSAKVSLMTVAPGPFVYSIFGHSAIRINDPVRQFDRCFNYGTFDFEQPNFILKFCRGRLMYFLDMEPYRSFEYGNLYDHRPMQEQVLNFSKAQKQELMDLLRENFKEENRNYKYDFFYDNCATRIRDIVQLAAGKNVHFDASNIPSGKTMRQLLMPYLDHSRWMRFGINLILGQAADRRAAPADYMFLPDYLHDMFKTTKLDKKNMLVASERNIPDPNPLPPPASTGFWGNPLWIMCVVALLGILSMWDAKAERIFDGVFWFVLGLAGVIIFLLWFATDHSATKLNWNILWALPSHLLFFWRKRGVTYWVESYFAATGLLALGLLALWTFIPQEMPLEAIPIVLLVFVKGLRRRLPLIRTAPVAEPERVVMA